MEYEKPTVANTLALMELYSNNPKLPSTPEEVKSITREHPSGDYVEIVFPRCIEVDEESGNKYMVTALWEDLDFIWFIRMVPVSEDYEISTHCVVAKLNN